MGIQITDGCLRTELPGHVGNSPITHGAKSNRNQHQKEKSKGGKFVYINGYTQHFEK